MNQEEFNKRYTFSAQDIISNCGGLGSIYRAYDNVLHREVTIKTAWTGCKALNNKRFYLKDEYEILKRIPKHQNIVFYDEYYCFEGSVMSYNFDGYDSDYVVMPYKVESNLSDLMQRELTMEQKEAIAVQLLDGLDFLHQNNVIHGNFDPWSILIIRTRDGFVPMLTNFGLNKPLPYDFPETPSDPLFYNRAPWGGYDEKYGKNGDIEMYGIILYELFTGRPLYEDCGDSLVDAWELFVKGDGLFKLLAPIPLPWRKVIGRILVKDDRINYTQNNISTQDLYDIINDNNAELPAEDDPGTIIEQPVVITGYMNHHRYKLRQKMGNDALAEEWLAENEDGKKVTVKMLNDGICCHKDILAAFVKEVVVLMKLRHPNIRQVNDYAMVDSRLCIIMEYLEGFDLETMMKQGRHFTDEELAKWWNQIVKALDYAHSKDVVHMDIKPSNVFIDKDGNVKLINFNIARNAINGFIISIMSEIPSWLYTSPVYMSPEWIRDRKHVDYRTDTYSLAVTFVHLLTGKPPYYGEIESDFEICSQIVYKPLDLSEISPFWTSILTPYLNKEVEKRAELKPIAETLSSDENMDGEDFYSETILADDFYTENNNMAATINGYTLRYQLGEGGMAEVWYAENKLGKKAAVKMLLPKFCDDGDVVARFENEAKVMVKLEHPNIRQVYDYTMVDGRPCIIMEYLEGDDLKSLMKQGRQFTHEELVKWWNQMVAALNYTHQLGVIHRDIKPSNIFIDKYGNVRLLDFGIAKNYDNAARTRTGSTMGTLLYMSPEQVKDPKRVTYKSDIYSLAVTFVHLVTNKAPYDSTSSSNFEIQMDIVQKPLDVSGLSPVWRSFLEPYLAKKPQDRPVLIEINIKDFRTTNYSEHTHTVFDSAFTTDLFLSTRVNDFMSFSEAFEIARREFGVNGVFVWHGHTYGTKTAEEWKALSTEEKDSYWEAVSRIISNLNEPDLVAPSDDLIVTANGVSFVMKYVEGGAFQKRVPLICGYDDYGPIYKEQRDIDAMENDTEILNSYYIGETLVTQALWKAVMGRNATTFEFKGDDFPVDCGRLAFEDHIDFYKRLKDITGLCFRWPSDAEWEYAASGGKKSKGYKYAGSNNLDEVAWFSENSENRTHPVKQKKANELGLYDMCGNLMESCRGGCYAFDRRECQINSRYISTAFASWQGIRLALSIEE